MGLTCGSVANCSNTGTITGNSNGVGGIAGECKSATSVTNSVNRGTVSGPSTAYGAGGIIGWVRYAAPNEASAYPVVVAATTVSGNTNYANVTGGTGVGGVVGMLYTSGTVTDNYSYAQTLTGAQFVSGIVGGEQSVESSYDQSIKDHKIQFNNNHTSTALADMTATNGESLKAQFIYINTQTDVTENEGNTVVARP